MKRIAFALVAAVVLGSSGSALAQYPDAAFIELDRAVVDCPSGEALTVTGSGFIPHEPFVRIFFDGDVIAEVLPDEEGSFSATIDPPAAAAGEHHTITAEQFVAPEEPDVITAVATVTCQAEAAVAFTGQNLAVAMMLVAGLLAIGVAALGVERRRAGGAA